MHVINVFTLKTDDNKTNNCTDSTDTTGSKCYQTLCNSTLLCQNCLPTEMIFFLFSIKSNISSLLIGIIGYVMKLVEILQPVQINIRYQNYQIYIFVLILPEIVQRYTYRPVYRYRLSPKGVMLLS